MTVVVSSPTSLVDRILVNVNLCDFDVMSGVTDDVSRRDDESAVNITSQLKQVQSSRHAVPRCQHTSRMTIRLLSHVK